jgi:hypothetical protein
MWALTALPECGQGTGDKESRKMTLAAGNIKPDRGLAGELCAVTRGCDLQTYFTSVLDGAK